MSSPLAEDQELVDRFFAEMHNGPHWFLSSSTLRVLRRQPADVVNMCQALLTTDGPAALRATLTLLALGEAPPLNPLRLALLSSERPTWATAVGFSYFDLSPNPDLLSLCEELAGQSGNHAIALSCARAGINLRGHSTGADLEAIERFHQGRTREAGSSIESLLKVFIERGSADLRAAGFRIYEQRLAIRPREQFAIEFFCHLADASCLPTLWQLLEEPEHRGPYSKKWSIMEAIARIGDDRLSDRVLSEAEGDGFDRAVPVLRTLFAGTKDPRALSLVARRAAALASRHSHSEACCALIAAIGGEPALVMVQDTLNHLPESTRASLLLQARGVGVEQRLRDLAKLGVLDADQLATALATRSDGSLPSQVLRAMATAKAVLTFDSEFSATPVPHHQLIVDLASITRGRFSPTNVRQTETGLHGEHDAYELRFDFQGQAWLTKCGDDSDWFDHVAVATCANRALAQCGEDCRFIPVVPDSQYPSYVFAPPSGARQAEAQGLLALDRYNLPVVLDEGPPEAWY